MTGDITSKHESHPAESGKDQLLSSIATSIRKYGEAFANIVSELMSSIGAASYLGKEGAAALFVTRLSFQFHTQYHAAKLKELVEVMNRKIVVLQENGCLIDPNDERNLWLIFDRIYAFMETRDEEKAELLRRVAVDGLIRRDREDVKERDFAYVIRVLEAEDITTLQEVDRVYKEVEARLSRPRESKEEPNITLPEGLDISAARLQAAGLIFWEPRWGHPVPRVTPGGREFMAYLKNVE